MGRSIGIEQRKLEAGMGKERKGHDENKRQPRERGNTQSSQDATQRSSLTLKKH
jgi:hypothetical protein